MSNIGIEENGLYIQFRVIFRKSGDKKDIAAESPDKIGAFTILDGNFFEG